MTDAPVSEVLVESMLSDFDVLAAACRAEVEETASSEVLAALRSPRLLWVCAHGLHYVQTQFEGEVQVGKLAYSRARLEQVSARCRRAEQLRNEAARGWRAANTLRHRRGGRQEFGNMCGWLMKMLLPEDYSRVFEAEWGAAPQRSRLPRFDWYAWAVDNDWLPASDTPDTDRLLSLDDSAFVAAVRRSLTVEYVPRLDESPVVERWYRALSSVELQVRADIAVTLGAARLARDRALTRRLDELRERYEEFAVLRVHRSVARRCFHDLRDTAITAVDAADSDRARGCHARTAAILAAAEPVLWLRVREAIEANRAVWESADFEFTTASAWAERLAADVATRVPRGPELVPGHESHADDGTYPLEVAVDASGYGVAGGYGWAAADGRTGGGRCTTGISATETEVMAICEAALSPALAGRSLHIRSDCVSAVEAIVTALDTGSVGAYPVSQAVRARVCEAIGRRTPFTVQWVASRTGHPLHDRAHRLARDHRFR
ncbi:hypothetical protein ACWEKT_05665 [Nocardia takedensis]